MKKVLIGILALIMVLGLVGCKDTYVVDSVILTTNSCEIIEGESFTLSYKVIPEEADISNFTWVSADESIATVDESESITAHKMGQTTVFLTDGEHTFATCSVTVLQKPAYDRLSDAERDFVDEALRHINDFKNPNSVEFLDICFVEGYGSAESFWVVEVSAQNSFGGTSSEIYVLNNTLGFYSNEYISVVPYGEYYDLDLVNEAIDDKL